MADLLPENRASGVFDPYATHRGGRIAAELGTALEALNRAFVDAVALAPNSNYREGVVGAISDAQDAVKAAQRIDLWELARP